MREILERNEEELRGRGSSASRAPRGATRPRSWSGSPGECGADLLVIGNKGMKRRVLGSVPNTVTHKADCSVLVVKTT